MQAFGVGSSAFQRPSVSFNGGEALEQEPRRHCCATFPGSAPQVHSEPHESAYPVTLRIEQTGDAGSSDAVTKLVAAGLLSPACERMHARRSRLGSAEKGLARKQTSKSSDVHHFHFIRLSAIVWRNYHHSLTKFMSTGQCCNRRIPFKSRSYPDRRS